MNLSHRNVNRGYTADTSAICELMNQVQTFTPLERVKPQTPVVAALDEAAPRCNPRSAKGKKTE